MPNTHLLISPRLPISRAGETIKRSCLGIAKVARAWPRLIQFVVPLEGYLQQYVELARGLRPVAETRLALVRLAHGMSGARRVELDLILAAGGTPWRVASWPPAGEPGWRQDEGEASEAGSLLRVSLRFGGRSYGTLRVIPGRSRRWPPRLVKRLTSLCALAAAIERTTGAASDDDAARDRVTGAYNAAFLNAFLTHAVAQARRRNEAVSVLCAGADWLVGVRAEHGTEIADAALRRMARAMMASLRTSDIVARLDDTRLAAVLPASPAGDGLRVADSVRRAIIEAGLTAATAVPLSASIGVAAYPDHALDVGPLLAAAGEALARARAHGPGGIAVAQPPIRSTSSSIIHRVRTT